MRSSHKTRLAVGGLLVLLGAPAPAAAQRFTFEFRPVEGSALRTLVEGEGRAVVVGVPDVADSTVVDLESRATVTRRAFRAGAGAYELRFSFESVRSRYRRGVNPWRVIPLPTESGLQIGYAAGGRLDLTMLDTVDSAAVTLLANAAGVPHFALPEGPVEVGGEWTSEVGFPFAMGIPGSQQAIVAAHLTGPAAGTLDSLVVRGTDTLAFMSVRARLLPTTIETALQLGGGPALAELWGSLMGRLIWSTAWNAFVSQSVAARVNQRFEAVIGSGVEDARITATVTKRVQVRP